jgi:hypothetical protein
VEVRGCLVRRHPAVGSDLVPFLCLLRAYQEVHPPPCVGESALVLALGTLVLCECVALLRSALVRGPPIAACDYNAAITASIVPAAETALNAISTPVMTPSPAAG